MQGLFAPEHSMRVFTAAIVFVLLAAPAYAQNVPQYGDTESSKSPSEIEAEKRAEKAYKRSLGNVPNATGSTDPWGSVRSEAAPKAAAKPAPQKRAKADNPDKAAAPAK
jgi:hypothetical protein